MTGVRVNDHKSLVELGWSATLVPAYYKPELVTRLVPSTGAEKKTLMFIVRGGFENIAAGHSRVFGDCPQELGCRGEMGRYGRR